MRRKGGATPGSNMRVMLAASITFACLLFVTCADKGQEDCQKNEYFVMCGQCEGSCLRPIPRCTADCRGKRCECLARYGFVRTKHGHCIRAHECPGPAIFSEDPYMTRTRR